MTLLTITAKGQVTLRKEFLDHLGVGPGDRISVDKLPDGGIAVRAARPAGQVSDAFNMLRREGMPALSVDDMNAVISEGWASRR